MAAFIRPGRGEVWLANLNPTTGAEIYGQRPVLVISRSEFNASEAFLVIVVPISGEPWKTNLHVEIAPPEGGLEKASYVRSEMVRSISHQRLKRRLGEVSNNTLAEVEDRLRILLDL